MTEQQEPATGSELMVMGCCVLLIAALFLVSVLYPEGFGLRDIAPDWLPEHWFRPHRPAPLVWQRWVIVCLCGPIGLRLVWIGMGISWRERQTRG